MFSSKISVSRTVFKLHTDLRHLDMKILAFFPALPAYLAAFNWSAAFHTDAVPPQISSKFPSLHLLHLQTTRRLHQANDPKTSSFPAWNKKMAVLSWYLMAQMCGRKSDPKIEKSFIVSTVDFVLNPRRDWSCRHAAFVTCLVRSLLFSIWKTGILEKTMTPDIDFNCLSCRPSSYTAFSCQIWVNFQPGSRFSERREVCSKSFMS